jgi:branched-subunit amino acid aminotransferase/4-amino-4-deoxychorismate lyase
MAKFEGIEWASRQMRYSLPDKRYDLLPGDASVHAVSRSVHYALFLAFEGIRFFARKNASGRLEVVFVNWDRNLDRFRRGMAYNLDAGDVRFVPTQDELVDVLVGTYFREPALRTFLEESAALGAQGYLRPFTVDEEQSIGVTFPRQPAIRAVVARYDRYLGEPFSGVVVPHLVRAVAVNKTGCLKLGVNYLISVKAVEEARKTCPEAAAALFLDDRTHLGLGEREITEWDSSCCLFALRDGTVVKIPESPLILPSVTIQGITAILRHWGIRVDERPLTYGELAARVRTGELVAVCSVGTAGILNRCQKLVLVDGAGGVLATHHPDEGHSLFAKLAEARAYYWDVYREKVPAVPGLKLYRYEI